MLELLGVLEGVNSNAAHRHRRIKNMSTYKYVFIPANDSLPIEVKEAPVCGLDSDNLSQTAKRYFYESSDKAARAAALDGASEEERKKLADQMRDEIKASGQAGSRMQAIDDDGLIAMLKATHTSNTCEITAVTVPTASNDHRAVSMYSADDSRTRGLPYNRRATELLVACGHDVDSVPTPNNQLSIGAAPPGGICGDCFVGRCHDDEKADIWTRVDFDLKDAGRMTFLLCLDMTVPSLAFDSSHFSFVTKTP